MTMENRHKGVVVDSDIGERGYGFIRCDDRRNMHDVYFKNRDLAPDVHGLTAGEHVSFYLVNEGRGARAKDVRRTRETTQ